MVLSASCQLSGERGRREEPGRRSSAAAIHFRRKAQRASCRFCVRTACPEQTVARGTRTAEKRRVTQRTESWAGAFRAAKSVQACAAAPACGWPTDVPASRLHRCGWKRFPDGEGRASGRSSGKPSLTANNRLSTLRKPSSGCRPAFSQGTGVPSFAVVNRFSTLGPGPGRYLGASP